MGTRTAPEHSSFHTSLLLRGQLLLPTEQDWCGVRPALRSWDPTALQPRWGQMGFSLQGTPCTTALPILLGSVTLYVTFEGGCILKPTLATMLSFLPMHHIHLGNECSENIFLYGHTGAQILRALITV